MDYDIVCVITPKDLLVEVTVGLQNLEIHSEIKDVKGQFKV